MHGSLYLLIFYTDINIFKTDKKRAFMFVSLF